MCQLKRDEPKRVDVQRPLTCGDNGGLDCQSQMLMAGTLYVAETELGLMRYNRKQFGSMLVWLQFIHSHKSKRRRCVQFAFWLVNTCRRRSRCDILPCSPDFLLPYFDMYAHIIYCSKICTVRLCGRACVCVCVWKL